MEWCGDGSGVVAQCDTRDNKHFKCSSGIVDFFELVVIENGHLFILSPFGEKVL